MTAYPNGFALMVKASPGAAFDGDKYLLLTAYVVSVADDGSPRNILADTYASDPAARYVGIAASAQASRRDIASDGDAPDYSYAWRFGIGTDSLAHDVIPFATVERSYGLLKSATRRMAAVDDKYGPVRTFGAYVARIADALALPVMFGRSGADGFYSSGDWRTVPSGQAVSVIDGWITAHRRA